MTYNTNYLKKGKKRTGKGISPTTYTIHSTGNEKSTAQNERAYLENPNNKTATGYHSVVDEKECILVIPFDEIAYHAGCKEGNETSLSLEICESGDREKTLRNAVEVVSKDLLCLGWGIDRVRQHYDWTQKNCPSILRDTNLWGWFLSEIQKNLKTEEIEGEEEMVYNYLDENMPSWAKGTVKKLVDKGLLKGDEKGEFGLNDTMLKLLVINDRAGLYD